MLPSLPLMSFTASWTMYPNKSTAGPSPWATLVIISPGWITPDFAEGLPYVHTGNLNSCIRILKRSADSVKVTAHCFVKIPFIKWRHKFCMRIMGSYRIHKHIKHVVFGIFYLKTVEDSVDNRISLNPCILFQLSIGFHHIIFVSFISLTFIQ